MSIHLLAFEDRVAYLKSIIANMKVLYRAGIYSTIESSFRQFDEVWGNPQDNQQLDELTAYIACLHYLAMYQLMLLKHGEDIAEELSQLQETIKTDQYIKQVNWELTAVASNHTVSTILDGSTTAAGAINTFLELIKKKNEEITVEALITDCWQQIDGHLEEINQDNYASYLERVVALMTRLSISFDKEGEMDSTSASHPLFTALCAKLATSYIRALAFEMGKKDSIEDKNTVFERLAKARLLVIPHDPTTEIVDRELNQAATQLQRDIEAELERLVQMDYSNCPESTVSSVKKNLQSILLAIVEDDGPYNKAEADKKSAIFFVCYKETKRLLAENPQDVVVVKTVKNLFSLLPFVYRKAAIKGPTKEDLIRFELKIECAELLCSKEQDDFLSRIVAVKLKLQEKRTALVGETPGNTDAEQLKSHWLHEAAKLTHEQQQLLLLINYYFAFYYHLMMGYYQGLDKYEQRNILLTKAILHYETAQSIRAISVEEADDAAYEELFSVCQKNYQEHCAYSLPHLIKFLKVELAKADKLFAKRDFASAASAYMGCWEFLNSHPVLMVDNTLVQSKPILFNAAQSYHLVPDYHKAWTSYSLLLRAPDSLSLPELFAIRAFLTEYLRTPLVEFGARYALENMHHMLSQRIGNSVTQLRQIVLHGPGTWQQQAYCELMANFKKDKELYHDFVHEVVSLYESHMGQHKTSNEATPIRRYLRRNFLCYEHVLYDIAANLNLNKLELAQGFNPVAISGHFFQMAVERGCGPACYDSASAKLKKGDYLNAFRQFKLAVLDEDWHDEHKKQLAQEQILVVQQELRRRQLANPLRLINSSDRSPEHCAFYDDMEQLLREQTPELPSALTSTLDSDNSEEQALDDSHESREEDGPKSILKTRRSGKGKRSYHAAFQAGSNLTLFAAKAAPAYDRTPVITPQYVRQERLKQQDSDSAKRPKYEEATASTSSFSKGL